MFSPKRVVAVFAVLIISLGVFIYRRNVRIPDTNRPSGALSDMRTLRDAPGPLRAGGDDGSGFNFDNPAENESDRLGEIKARAVENPPPSAPACLKQHDGQTSRGEPVVVCDAFYPERPFVRPPADNLQDKTHVELYAAVYFGNGYLEPVQLVDRTGVHYSVLDKNQRPVTQLSGLPRNLGMPENSVYYVIYRVFGSLTDGGIVISEMEPAIMLTGCAIDSAMLGTWEGTVSARLDDNDFDSGNLIPIRIVFDQLKPDVNLYNYKGTKRLSDAAVYDLYGRVENMSALPSNPFKGAAAEGLIEIFRVTVMHIAGDNHIGINYPSGMLGLSPTGMSEGDSFGPFYPASLIQTNPTGDFYELKMNPHAPPFGPHSNVIYLHPTSVGGHPAQCP